MTRQRLGVRWQGGSRDTAFGRTHVHRLTEAVRVCESGVALRFPPLDQSDARAMLKEIKGAKLLEGYRGAPPCDVEALIETLVAFGRMVAATDGQYDAIDINPLMAFETGKGVMALDALIVTESR